MRIDVDLPIVVLDRALCCTASKELVVRKVNEAVGSGVGGADCDPIAAALGSTRSSNFHRTEVSPSVGCQN